MFGEEMKYVWDIAEVHIVEQLTCILVDLLGKQQVIMMVIWMSREFGEAYLGAQQIHPAQK